MTNEDDLSRAVVLYLAYDTASSPRADPDALIAAFGAQRAAELSSAVVALLKEARAIEIDWTGKSLADGGDIAKATMTARHPDLSPKALDTIDWKWTFDWR